MGAFNGLTTGCVSRKIDAYFEVIIRVCGML